MQILTKEISEILSVSNEGDVTYFENVTSAVLFQKFILNGEFGRQSVETKCKQKSCEC